VLLVAGLSILTLSFVLIAANYGNRSGVAADNQALGGAPVNAASPAPTAQPSPSPSPADESREGNRSKPSDRENRQARGRDNRKKGPSRVGKIVNKMKKILKNPF
jgi:hypothetical protein